MSRDILDVLDEVVRDAHDVERQKATEIASVKEASAAPTSDVAVGLRKIADALRQAQSRGGS